MQQFVTSVINANDRPRQRRRQRQVWATSPRYVTRGIQVGQNNKKHKNIEPFSSSLKADMSSAFKYLLYFCVARFICSSVRVFLSSVVWFRFVHSADRQWLSFILIVLCAVLLLYIHCVWWAAILFRLWFLNSANTDRRPSRRQFLIPRPWWEDKCLFLFVSTVVDGGLHLNAFAGRRLWHRRALQYTAMHHTWVSLAQHLTYELGAGGVGLRPVFLFATVRF